jgi:hypothetical protein
MLVAYQESRAANKATVATLPAERNKKVKVKA